MEIILKKTRRSKQWQNELYAINRFGTGPLHVAAYTDQLYIFVDLSLNGDINPKNTKYQMAAIFSFVTIWKEKRQLGNSYFWTGTKTDI